MTDGWDSAIEITMKFDSKCRECKEPMEEGTRGLWLKGQGVKHVDCDGEVTTYTPKPKEEKKSSIELFDETKYDYQTTSDLKYCQYCGGTIDNSIGDRYINKDLKSCQSCFKL